MKRIFLSAAGLLSILSIFSQTPDSTGFRSRKLKVDEINLVSSYYTQTGNNAAVTGGLGSQKLTDIANVIDVRLIRYDRKLRKHSFDVEVGIDHYTSASSDKIDLKANSSASSADTRVYPSINWSIENEQKGTTLTAGVAYSGEYDYQSFGGNVQFALKSRDRSGELSLRLQAYLDQISKILPVELRSNPDPDSRVFDGNSRNSFAGTISYSQIINKELQIMITGDVIQQSGYLGLPFYRVYFNDGTVHQEALPTSRTKVPVGIRASYFAGDKLIIRTYYRYYFDNWGVKSNTISLETPLKLNPFLSVTPFARYYTQSQADYFKPYGQHTAEESFYTSNFDLSKFNSLFLGAGIRISPPRGVFGIQHFSMAELRYGHYAKNIDMSANIITLHLKWK